MCLFTQISLLMYSIERFMRGPKGLSMPVPSKEICIRDLKFMQVLGPFYVAGLVDYGSG